MIAIAIFISMVPLNVRADAVDIKIEWVSTVSEAMVFSLFIDQIYETECENHLPARDISRLLKIENWILSQPSNETGRENLDVILQSVRNSNVMDFARQTAQQIINGIVQLLQTEGMKLGDFCPKLLDEYHMKADNLVSGLKEKTQKLLKKFPNGIVIKSH